MSDSKRPTSEDGTDSEAGMVSRRRALQMGAGLGATLFGGSLLAACGDDSGGTGGGKLEKVRVGFAYIGPVNDNGWTQEHHRGRAAMIAALGDKFDASSKFVENVGFDPAVTGPIMEELAANHDLVIANTEYQTLLSDVAKKHPDVKFLECDGHTHSANEDSYYLSHHQATYAMGVAAAMLNKGNDCKIGYIGAFPTATAFNDVNGLLLGARSVNAKATVKAVMISSFFDPTKATAAAKALVSEKVNFIFAVMDEPSFLQVANDAKVWAGAWNTDVRQFGPDVYVNTLQLDFGPYYTEVANGMLDGSLVFDDKPNLQQIDLGAWGDKVPADVRTAVDAIRAKLKDGSLNPYTGPLTDTKGTERLKAGETIDNQGAYKLDWALDGVTGV
jgi:basic membrane protein A and related proteins